MIEVMSGLPDKVLGITASGQVSGDDYANILKPEIEKKLQVFEKIRMLYRLGPDFKKFTTTALWDDASIGFHHLNDFERVAVVTDIEWILKMVRAAGLMLPCDLRTFANDELDSARTWVTGDDEV